MLTILMSLSAALLIGLCLGLLGAGGAILTTPLLIYVVGEPVKQAIVESLLIVAVISGYGTYLQYRKGSIDWRSAFKLIGPCILGAIAGTSLAARVHADIQLLTFAAVATISSVLMIINIKPAVKKHSSNDEPLILIMFVGLCVGALAGFVGVGGGFLIVPTLVLILAIPPKQAVATSLSIITLQSFAGFFSAQFTLPAEQLLINWNLILLVSFCGCVGMQLGSSLDKHISEVLLRRIFGIFLAAIGGAITLIKI